jgi:hypothetical protein
VNDGAEERRRSADTAIFSRVLYHLSYLGMRENDGAVGETGLEPVTFRV